MVFHSILRLLHIVSFAAWFGTILASLFFLKAMESKLTGNDDNTAEYAQLLQRFLKLETKVADVAVIGVILSGILLAVLYHGWTIWVFVKSFLIVLQIALTIGYIIRSVRTLTYPCSNQEYNSWYRMKGLLRFEKLRDGAYLAKMEPDYNIINPLAYHFSHRLRAQHWFLYDVKRRTAARWNNGTLQFGTIEQFTAPALSEDEKKVQDLWKAFFKTIAIPDRKNPHLQKSNMPMNTGNILLRSRGSER